MNVEDIEAATILHEQGLMSTDEYADMILEYARQTQPAVLTLEMLQETMKELHENTEYPYGPKPIQRRATPIEMLRKYQWDQAENASKVT